MRTYLIAFVSSLLVAMAVTPLVAALGHKINAIDRPDGGRKVHTRAIPRIGGIAVAVAFFVPIVSISLYDPRAFYYLYNIYHEGQLVFALAIGALAILLLGIYDDLRNASPILKLAVQGAVAVFLWTQGFRFNSVAGYALGMWSLPVTIIWLVGVINALNLIDGLDGLAAGTALFAVVVLFGVAIAQQAILLALLAAALGGSLLGFLFFNFNPARIFLGDCGSMFLGLLLGTISIWTQMKGATLAALGIPIMALGLPLLDTALSFVRRISKGTSPFKADRGHIHHRIMQIGASHKDAVYTLYFISAVFGLGALSLLDDAHARQATALSLVMVAVVLLVRKIGGLHGPKSLIQTTPTSDLREEIRAAARRIRAAESLNGAWFEITKIAPRFNIDELRVARRETDSSGSDGELVLRWRAPRDGSSEPDISAAWRAVMAEPERSGKKFDLSEDGVRYGDLLILYTPGKAPEASLAELVAELLRDALVDLHVRLSLERAAEEVAQVAETDPEAARALLEPAPAPEDGEKKAESKEEDAPNGESPAAARA